MPGRAKLTLKPIPAPLLMRSSGNMIREAIVMAVAARGRGAAAALADAAGVTRPNLSDYLAGKTDVRSAAAAAMLDHLGIALVSR